MECATVAPATARTPRFDALTLWQNAGQSYIVDRPEMETRTLPRPRPDRLLGLVCIVVCCLWTCQAIAQQRSDFDADAAWQQVVARCGEVPKRACIVEHAVARMNPQFNNFLFVASAFAEQGDLQHAKLLFAKAREAQPRALHAQDYFRYVFALADHGDVGPFDHDPTTETLGSDQQISILMRLYARTGESSFHERARRLLDRDISRGWHAATLALAEVYGRAASSEELVALVSSIGIPPPYDPITVALRAEIARRGIVAALERHDVDKVLGIVAVMPVDLQPMLNAPVAFQMAMLNRIDDASKLMRSVIEQDRERLEAETMTIGLLAKLLRDDDLIRREIEITDRYRDKIVWPRRLLLLAIISGSRLPLAFLREKLSDLARSRTGFWSSMGFDGGTHARIDAWSCVAAAQARDEVWIDDCVGRIGEALKKRDTDVEDYLFRLWHLLHHYTSGQAAMTIMHAATAHGLPIESQKGYCDWLIAGGESESARAIINRDPRLTMSDTPCVRSLYASDLKRRQWTQAVELLRRFNEELVWNRALLELTTIAPE